MNLEAAYRRSTDSISFSYIPVVSQYICLLKLNVHRLQLGCIEQLFFSASKVDGHWIMLRLYRSHGCSASLGVNGGAGWPRRWASAWIERQTATNSLIQFIRIRTFPCLSSISVLVVGHHLDSGKLRSELQVLYSDLLGDWGKLCDFLVFLIDMELDSFTNSSH